MMVPTCVCNATVRNNIDPHDQHLEGLMRYAAIILGCAIALCGCAPPLAFQAPDGAIRPYIRIDTDMESLMSAASVPGLALALIEDGKVVRLRAYGQADLASGRPLRSDSIMYGASLTKAAFAYMVMQLVDEGLIDLDAPLPRQLRKPLSDYPEFADLAGGERWRQVTPRMLLSHSSGLLNWRWINPDRKLDFKFAPGSRYVYSGEGIQLLQLVVEERTGQPVAQLMQQRVFDRFRMKDTSMVWRADFDGREVVHYGAGGEVIAHARRARARAAGSMDTTLADFAEFFAGVLRGDGLSARAHAAMLSPQLAIVSPRQFPSHWPGVTDANRAIGLSIGLGWPVFDSPLGPAFFKEGNDDGTNNFAFGLVRQRSGVLMLSNSSNAQRMFYPALESLLGRTCLPWFWMGYIPYDRPTLFADNTAAPVVTRGCGAPDSPAAATVAGQGEI
jgi:CubicO group peptidase (beta-lactamase class C family)